LIPDKKKKINIIKELNSDAKEEKEIPHKMI
jgi:hypothetical protein